MGLALWLVLVPALAIGWGRNLDCLRAGQSGADQGDRYRRDLFAGDSYSVRNQSLVNAVRHLGNWIAEDVAGGGDSLRTRRTERPATRDGLAGGELAAARRAVGGADRGGAGGVVWAGRRRDALTTASLFGLGLVATLVVSPVARTHYFLLIAPAVLWVPLVFRAHWAEAIGVVDGLDADGADRAPVFVALGGRPGGMAGDRHDSLAGRRAWHCCGRRAQAIEQHGGAVLRETLERRHSDAGALRSPRNCVAGERYSSTRALSCGGCFLRCWRI